jgi:hypothetical protein
MLTVQDCHLNGKSFSIKHWTRLDSTTLGQIVGVQEPGHYPERLDNLLWTFQYILIEKLRYANQDYEEPKGGWSEAYLRFLESDRQAAVCSPEYLGRDTWIKEHWTQCTDIYPLYVVLEEDGYRLLDGHHRLAGAFYYKLDKVAIILGTNS